MNRKITKEGFDFVLSPTSNQVLILIFLNTIKINIILYHYTKLLEKESYEIERVINFIFDLSLCMPEQVKHICTLNFKKKIRLIIAVIKAGSSAL